MHNANKVSCGLSTRTCARAEREADAYSCRRDGSHSLVPQERHERHPACHQSKEGPHQGPLGAVLSGTHDARCCMPDATALANTEKTNKYMTDRLSHIPHLGWVRTVSLDGKLIRRPRAIGMAVMPDTQPTRPTRAKGTGRHGKRNARYSHRTTTEAAMKSIRT